MKRSRKRAFLIDSFKGFKLRFCLLSLLSSFVIHHLYSSENLKLAAFDGNVRSQFQLGIIYKFGAKEDLQESYYWMKMAAQKNHPIASRYVGLAHLYGLGTSKSIDLAKKWFLSSSKKGDALSMVGLAKCLEIEGNLIESAAWFKLAYKYGEKKAMQSFKSILSNVRDENLTLLDEVINNLESSITVTVPSKTTSELGQQPIQRIELENGNSYWGNVLNGIPHGYGKKKSSYGTSYQGEFKNGMEDGYGTSFDQSGDITYQGIWKRGTPYLHKTKVERNVTTNY
jgi:hypothetical protein